ncbi:MAG: DMT family transporter [Clostridiales bacterium]|nr:DMT family transporter [Clostridiales bacterium]
MNRQWGYVGLLVLLAMIWGVCFAVQEIGNVMGAFAFNGIRCLLGGLALLPVWALRRSSGRTQFAPTDKRATWLGGLYCGLTLFVASSLQQHGLLFTTVGKAGFITALYVVFVPVLGLLLKRKVSWNIWLAVVGAVVGLYLLCMRESLRLEVGDLLVFGCAVMYAIYILQVAHYAPKADTLLFTSLQLLISGVLGLVAMWIFESPSWSLILPNWWTLLYAGLISSAVGLSIQMFAQRRVNPTVASLIFSLEAVFAVLAGLAFFGDRLTQREILGCVVLFAATVFAQLHFKRRSQNEL